MTTRRTILRAAALGGASLFLPASAMAAGGMGGGGCNCGGGGGGGMGGGGMGGGMGMTCSLPASPATTPFQMSLPIPKALPKMPIAPDNTAEWFELHARHGTAKVYKDWNAVDVISYQGAALGDQGTYLGPTIVATTGKPTKVRVWNELDEPISVHLHGGKVRAESDGHPLNIIMPRMQMDDGSWMSADPMDYEYPNNQIASTLWYHDHAMGYTSQHAYYGLAGAYVITDDVEGRLALPKGDYDVPLVIQDRRFQSTPSGIQLYYLEDSCTIMQGFMGDKLLVNGVIQPFLQVANRKYRFRILNGSQARFYNLKLSNGQSFQQIGTDGGLLPAPITRSSMLISPGERIEVVIDFAGTTNRQIVLQNTLGSGDTYQVMRFDVVRSETEQYSVPKTLRSFTKLNEKDAVRTRKFTLSMLGMSSEYPWGINGKAYDPKRIDADPKLGDVEIWEIVNPMGMNHNFHTHAIMWQLLTRNGTVAAPYEAGWKDTFAMQGMTTIRIIGRFDAYQCPTGVYQSPMPMDGMTDYYMSYMAHCHILEHEDNGMMSGWSIV